MMKKKLFVFIFYGLLSLFFLKGVIFSPGIIIGSDWSLPLTLSQMKTFREQLSFVWTNGYNLLGARLSYLNTFHFGFFVSFFPKIGLNGAVFSKILLVFLFTLIGFSSFYFCRKIGLSFKSSLLAGFIYMTTPLVFNYSIMGWIFVLLVMMIIPFFLLSFFLSVEKEKIGYSIFAGLLFAIALFQSQTVFWFPILMIVSFPFLVSSKRQFWVFLRFFFIVIFLAVLLHANWLLPLIFAPDPQLSQAVSAYDIQRFGIRLSFVNMLRLWGGLFNYQFEMVYPRVLLPVSFSLPFFAFLAVFLRKKNKKVLYLAVIALLPLIIYSLRNVFYRLPFSIVIRDLGRMMVLSAFPYSVLAAASFEELGKIKRKTLRKLLLAVIVLLFFLNSLPFWTGELYGESKIDHDQRLRTLEFPKEYQETEEFLSKEKTDTRALYLPTGLFLGFLDNKKFYGPYKEAVDIFALLSQKPGAFAFSDKTTGLSVDYGKLVLRAIEDKETIKLRNLLQFTSINNLVVRKNAYGVGGKGLEIEKTILTIPDIIKVFDAPKVSVYQANSFLPHFYIPQNIIYSKEITQELPAIMTLSGSQSRIGIYFENTDENEKLRNEEILRRATEIFIKANSENKVEKDYFEKKESFKNNILFPYVKHKPGSFSWKLARLKEKYEERRVEKDPEKLIDKKLFFAGKRISELEKFEENDGLTDLILANYKNKMEEAILEIKKLRNSEIEKLTDLSVIKLRAYWERHKEEIEDIYGDKLKYVSDSEKYKESFNAWERVFEELDGKIKYLEKPFDLRNLEYSFEIPKEGNYEIFGEVREIGELGIEIDGNKIEIDSNKIEKKGEWIKLGEGEFEKGKHQLVLHLPEQENLVGTSWQKLEEMKVKEEGVEFSPQTFYPDAKNLVSQEINNWQQNNLYYLSFDYKAEGGNLGISVLEERNEYPEREKVKIEKIFNKDLRNRIDEEWKKYEGFLKADNNTLGAKIYFYSQADPNQFAKVDFKNLRVYKIVQPKVMLQTKTDLTDKERMVQTMPKVFFVKINPTKYRVKVEGAKDPYTLVFSESFHQGWKAYLDKITNSKFPASAEASAGRQIPNEYGEIVASYFNGEIKEGTHKNIFLDKNTFETWGKKPIAEEKHLMVNGYANSWYIKPEDSGGKEDYELIIEFKPQGFFYLGLGISLVTIIVSFGYLAMIFLRKKS